MKCNFKPHSSHYFTFLTVLDDNQSPSRFSSVSMFFLLACFISHLLHCIHHGSSSQASNGPSGSYTCSLPSTPVLSHRELRVAQSEAGGIITSRSLKNIPRRPSLFKVSHPHPLTSLAPPLSIAPPPRSFCCCRSKLCCRLCFRTETRRRRLLRVKETWSPCEVFPLNRFVDQRALFVFFSSDEV